MWRYLGQLWLGQAWLAHLGGLAHGDVALCQRPLGEGLGSPIQADLAGGAITLTGTLVSADPLPATAAEFTLHSSTALLKKSRVRFKMNPRHLNFYYTTLVKLHKA